MNGTEINKVQVERLAYWLWQQRGMPIGSSIQDWFQAEALLKPEEKRPELSPHKITLFAFGIERLTR